MKARLLFLLLALLTTVPLAAQSVPGDTGRPQELPKAALHIGKATLHTQIAATSQQREIGLMHVTSMKDNDGMIFLMPGVERVTFWMKNTLIPLSIAFIDKNGVILEIHDMETVDPSTPDAQIPRLQSTSDQVAYALETNLHWFSLNGLKAGDKLDPAPATLGQPQP